jgi:tRNA 2-thiouridine synthesizing protein B
MLHIVNRSPYERPALEACLRVAQPGSALLLIEDGVYAAADAGAWRNRLQALAERIKVYVLAPDLEARGLQERASRSFERVDYSGFVDLVMKYPVTQSWL